MQIKTKTPPVKPLLPVHLTLWNWQSIKSDPFPFLVIYLSLLIQELVGGDEEKKDWWGISLSILTVILIGVLVGLSVVILTPAEVLYGPPLNYTQALEISKAFEDDIFTKRQWKGGKLVMMSSNKDLVEGTDCHTSL